MPDALSRRSDYHPGKGTTMDQEHNFVQALPGFSVHSAESSGSLDHSNEFSNLSNSSVECHPGSNSSVTSLPNSSFSPVSAILRALIPTPSVERNFFVTDSDILDGLRVDLEISPVFNGMLAMICTDCSHPSCHFTNHPSTLKVFFPLVTESMSPITTMPDTKFLKPVITLPSPDTQVLQSPWN